MYLSGIDEINLAFELKEKSLFLLLHEAIKKSYRESVNKTRAHESEQSAQRR